MELAWIWAVVRIMKNDSQIPKLSRKQKLQLVLIALILISMMILTVTKFSLLIDMWSN
jgi:hypothetical protein